MKVIVTFETSVLEDFHDVMKIVSDNDFEVKNKYPFICNMHNFNHNIKYLPKFKQISKMLTK